MLIKRVNIGAAEFDDPASAPWQALRDETVALIQAPAAMQPTRYITTKWQNQPYGQTKGVAVKALHNAREIAFRLEWLDPTKNEQRAENTDFPDAVAMLFGFAMMPLCSFTSAALISGTTSGVSGSWRK